MCASTCVKFVLLFHVRNDGCKRYTCLYAHVRLVHNVYQTWPSYYGTPPGALSAPSTQNFFFLTEEGKISTILHFYH